MGRPSAADAADGCMVNYFFTLPPTIFSQVPSGT